MKFYVKSSVSGTWPLVKNFWVKTTADNAFWSEVKKAWVKVSEGGASAWKQFWEAPGPKIDQEVTLNWTLASGTRLITFTGTNYKWTTNVGERYYFKGDPNLSVTLATGVAVDNTSYTYTLTNADIVRNEINHFQFAVKATASSGAITTSESPSYAIDMPRPTTISGATGTRPITVTWNADLFSNSYDLYVKKSTDSGFQSLGVTNSTSKTFNTMLTCPTGYSLAGNFCYGNAYPYPISSATSSPIAYETTYDFVVMSFGGSGGTGYSSDTGPVFSYTTGTAPRMVCDPRFNPNCGPDNYVSYTQPTVNSNPQVGSSAGSVCHSTATTGYKYYQSEYAYACDTPVSVSGYSATCTGCSISASTTYSWNTTRYYYSCNGSTIYSAGNDCHGCGTWSETTYSCSPGSSSTCTYGPLTSTTNPTSSACSSSSSTSSSTTYTCNGSAISTAYPYNNCQGCTTSSTTTYSCPSGSTGSGSGANLVCLSNTYPYPQVTRNSSTSTTCSPKANTTSTTTYTYYQYETTANCSGTSKSTNASGTGCSGCGVSSVATSYCSPFSTSACDTAHTGSTFPTTYCGSVSSSTDYTCPSRRYSTCTAGPYFDTVNPTFSACSSQVVSAYMYGKWGDDAWSCDSTTHYYAAYGSDPGCKGCLTYDYYGQ